MLKKFAILAILLAVSGCLGLTGPTVVSDGCLIFQPIHGNPAEDSELTMHQIDDHNATGAILCGW